KWVLVQRITRPRAADPPHSAFHRLEPKFAVPRAASDRLLVTWVGHSSFLLQVGGLNVLTDPMWSSRASPVGFAGPTGDARLLHIGSVSTLSPPTWSRKLECPTHVTSSRSDAARGTANFGSSR